MVSSPLPFFFRLALSPSNWRMAIGWGHTLGGVFVARPRELQEGGHSERQSQWLTTLLGGSESDRNGFQG